LDETPAHAQTGRKETRNDRPLIQLLEALPPNTRIPAETSMISTLKGKVQNKRKYVSEEEQDRIDTELLRKRSKAARKLVDWEKVKARYGVP
jgi:hypothetical protein